MLVLHWFSKNEPAQAMKVLDDSINRNSRIIYLQIIRLFYQCQLNNDSIEQIKQLIHDIPDGKVHISINTPVIQTLQQFLKGKCLSLNSEQFSQIVQLLIAHPGTQDYRIMADLHYVLSILKSTEGDLNGAMLNMDKSVKYYPKIKLLLLQARWLISAGLFDDAIIYTEKARGQMYTLNQMHYKEHIESVEKKIKRQKENKVSHNPINHEIN